MSKTRREKRIEEELRRRAQMDEEEVRELEESIISHRKELGGRLKAHLENFNDGVIAIFITIMILGIPYPSDTYSIHAFRENIFIFIVSFFMVADFWYELHRTFTTFEEADHWVVVSDFLFLAALALIPIMTKWIMADMNRRAVINFGFVYFVATVLEALVFFVAHRKKLKLYSTVYRGFMLLRIFWGIVLNGVLMVLSFFFTKPAIYMFLILPIVSFFFPYVRLYPRHGGAARRIADQKREAASQIKRVKCELLNNSGAAVRVSVGSVFLLDKIYPSRRARRCCSAESGHPAARCAGSWAVGFCRKMGK